MDWALENSLTDDVAPFREGIDFDIHLTNFEERYKEFKYSGDGLLRLIKLDFGLRDDYEDLNEFRNVNERMIYNIQKEDNFEPPIKCLKKDSVENQAGEN